MWHEIDFIMSISTNIWPRVYVTDMTVDTFYKLVPDQHFFFFIDCIFIDFYHTNHIMWMALFQIATCREQHLKIFVVLPMNDAVSYGWFYMCFSLCEFGVWLFVRNGICIIIIHKSHSNQLILKANYERIGANCASHSLNWSPLARNSFPKTQSVLELSALNSLPGPLLTEHFMNCVDI